METYSEQQTAVPGGNISEHFQQLLLSETMQQFSGIAPDRWRTWQLPEHGTQGATIILNADFQHSPATTETQNT